GPPRSSRKRSSNDKPAPFASVGDREQRRRRMFLWNGHSPPRGRSRAIEALGARLKRRRRQDWWAVTDSNRRHPACKAGALPTELTALTSFIAAVRGRGKAGRVPRR